uniref:Serine protease inhibitor dipetalogastin n=1 Tax=Magallana gigas TaxID=29159 RepID=K1QU08_MAGGI
MGRGIIYFKLHVQEQKLTVSDYFAKTLTAFGRVGGGVNIQYRGKCSSKWMLDERVPLCYDLPCLCKFTREPDACCFKHEIAYSSISHKCRVRKWEALCNGTAVCGCDYCDEGYSPVCSRTGNTYHNLCKLGCVDDEEFACNGTCPCSPTPGPPVCGSDGVTYPSPEEALKGKVAISCDGSCPCSTDCVCNDTSDPVCGEDDVTYDNACKAICSGVEIACQTCCPCPEIAPTCTFCDYNYNFVCGKDNTTYANECCASCAVVYFTVTQENDRELVFPVLYTAGAVLTRAWTLGNNCGH